MCGIVIGSGAYWNENKINEYLKTIKHRGPDNTGVYINGDFYMGHVRLSIIDTTEDSNQPFFFDKYVVSYNGEMFNYIEERSILIDKGYTFNTESDTEVIIQMFKEYGLEFIHRVNGMFVISIYDTESKNIYIWRDRFGIKPFYYTIQKGSFIGCSEIKPILLDSNLDNFSWNKYAISSYIKDSITHYSNETFYDGILNLEPGCFMEINTLNNDLKISKYFTLKKLEDVDSEISSDKLKRLLKDSVKIRMRSDVGFSSALSGGIDSSLITRLMQEVKKGDKIEVFSMLRESKDDFDTEFSLKYKELFPANNYTRVTPSKDKLTSILDEVIYSQEEPFGGPSIVLQNLMYRYMNDKGIKVIIEGQGGDEVFIGYERYLFRDNVVQFFFKGGLGKISNQTGIPKIKTIFYWFFFRYSFIRKYASIKKFGFKTSKLFKKYSNSNYISSFSNDLRNEDIRINEITKFQLRRLLNYSDKNSMASSVEVRLPFLDYRVVEAAISISPPQMTKGYWSKYLLRTFLADFGLKEFAWRKNKNGFDAPVEMWDVLEFYPKKSSVEKFFHFDSIKNMDSKLKWKIANIRAIEKIYNVSI